MKKALIYSQAKHSNRNQVI